MNNDITAERLRELLHYDPGTGWVVNAITRNSRALVGARAGSIGPKGYRRVKINGKLYLEHRLIWVWHHGATPTHQLDHIDGDPTNNRIENLREATNSQNCANQGKRSTNTSGYKGVSSKAHGKWLAQICSNGTVTHLGYFSDREDAAAAYQAAALKYFGEFARS